MTRRVTPFADPRQRFSAGTFGMWLFLASLAMLFAASILGYLIVRWQFAQDARGNPAGAAAMNLPPLPALLWLSTLILIASSATMQMAVIAARRDAQRALRAAMVVTFLLGIAFLVTQSVCWMQMIDAHAAAFEQLADMPRYVIASFYVLTALHAAHVIGGLIPMALVAARSLAGRYGPGRDAAVHYLSMYWHFLDGVWIVLFSVLLLAW
jgi:cytochrome c oxidase subunit 3